MDFPMFIVDAFSSKPFSGNPAAVCLDVSPNGLDTATMLSIAKEMNLSETAFIRRIKNEPGGDFSTGSEFGLRWFTPTIEVRLCGHATMASAAALFYCLDNPSSVLGFHTLSGRLEVQKVGEKLQLNLPLDPPVAITDRSEFECLLKDLPSEVADVQLGVDNKILIVRLSDSLSRQDMENICVPSSKWRQEFSSDKILAVGITLKAQQDSDASGKRYDFLSRFFGFGCGVDEDPVTGALHTILSAYWMKQLGKSKLYARQCSPRGGDVEMHVLDENRVLVSGPATVILRGNIHV